MRLLSLYPSTSCGLSWLAVRVSSLLIVWLLCHSLPCAFWAAGPPPCCPAGLAPLPGARLRSVLPCCRRCGRRRRGWGGSAALLVLFLRCLPERTLAEHPAHCRCKPFKFIWGSLGCCSRLRWGSPLLLLGIQPSVFVWRPVPVLLYVACVCLRRGGWGALESPQPQSDIASCAFRASKVANRR